MSSKMPTTLVIYEKNYGKSLSLSSLFHTKKEHPFCFCLSNQFTRKIWLMVTILSLKLWQLFIQKNFFAFCILF